VLGFDPQTTLALLLGADADVGDQRGGNGRPGGVHPNFAQTKYAYPFLCDGRTATAKDNYVPIP
jgi:hypothetical protein